MKIHFRSYIYTYLQAYNWLYIPHLQASKFGSVDKAVASLAEDGVGCGFESYDGQEFFIL